jgi:hypothetical protein
MSTNTYVALDKVTVGTATSTITFTGINQGYTDLVLVYQGATAAAANMFVRVGNGSLDTGSNYSLTQIVGSGSSASSSRLTSQAEIKITEGLFVNTNEQCNIIMNFQNYSNTTTNKTLLSRANSAAIGVQAQASLWRSTSAINTISVYASQNFNTGTTISLYGIAASGVSPAAKATGGTIYSDDLYYYHVFGSTGTFTPLSSLTADVLTVAGGGGGSRGGGGAGGVAYYASQSLTATGYTCTVGGGGAGSTDSEGSNAAKGTSGGNSSFTGLTAAVGGGGAGADYSTVNNGLNGGSGGGSGYGRPSSDTRATGTAGQGSSGGLALSDSTTYTSGGGGGGAGAQGGDVNSTSKTGGIGGVGITTYSSWGTATGIGENVSGTYYLAGGGGGGGNTYAGGAGGYGGGAAGKNTGSSNNGLANTGGGGGGNADGVTCGQGGSGVVIIRYLKA